MDRLRRLTKPSPVEKSIVGGTRYWACHVSGSAACSWVSRDSAGASSAVHSGSHHRGARSVLCDGIRFAHGETGDGHGWNARSVHDWRSRGGHGAHARQTLARAAVAVPAMRQAAMSDSAFCIDFLLGFNG